MPAMTAKEWGYLRDYAQSHDLKPQLSLPSTGMFRFLGEDGREVNVSMLTMKHETEEMKAQKRAEGKRVR